MRCWLLRGLRRLQRLHARRRAGWRLRGLKAVVASLLQWAPCLVVGQRRPSTGWRIARHSRGHRVGAAGGGGDRRSSLLYFAALLAAMGFTAARFHAPRLNPWFRLRTGPTLAFVTPMCHGPRTPPSPWPRPGAEPFARLSVLGVLRQSLVADDASFAAAGGGRGAGAGRIPRARWTYRACWPRSMRLAAQAEGPHPGRRARRCSGCGR